MGKNDQSADAKPKEVLLTKSMQTQITERLNEKLDSMKLQYEQILNKNQIYLNKLMKKISVFEGLPQNLSGLATLPVADFYKYAANLE